MNGHSTYRTLLTVVLVFIVCSVAAFDFMAYHYFGALEKPILDQLHLQFGDQSPSGVLVLAFGLLALAGAVLPWVVNKKELMTIDYYVLVLLFIIIPVVYSKDTKENFLLVKETHFRIFLIGLLALYFYRNVTSGRLAERLRDVPLFGWVLLAMSTASIAWSVSPIPSTIEAAILWSYLCFYLVLGDALRQKWQLVALCNVAVAMAALDSAYGILQYFGYDPLFGAGEVIGNVDRKRLFSFFGNPVFLGVYLDAIIPVALGMFLYAFPLSGDYVNRAERIINRIAVGVIVLCLVYPPLYVIATQSLLASELGQAGINALSQTNSVAVSQVMKEAANMTIWGTLLAVAGFLFALEQLRFHVPLFREHDRRFSQVFIGFFGFLLILICLVFTFTRTAWIATGVAIALMLLLVSVFTNELVYRFRRPVLIAFFAVLIAGVGLTYLNFNNRGLNWGTESISGRLTSSFTVLQRMMLFDISAKMCLDRPAQGFGLDTFEFNYPLYQRKFYLEGPFVLIPGANALCATPVMNFLLNFLIYLFFKMNISGLYLAAVGLYVVGGGSVLMLYIVYVSRVRNRATHAWVAGLLLLPLLLLMAEFNTSTYGKKLAMLSVTYSDGSNHVLHQPAGSVKLGDLKDTATDAKATAVRDLFLAPGENVLPEKAMDYDWLAADFDNAHNEYLQVWAEIGLPGLVAYLLFFGLFFAAGIRLIRGLADPAERLIVIGFLAGVVACLVESLANFPYHRLMPVIVTVLAYLVVYRGPRIFDSFGAPSAAAGAPVPPRPAEDADNLPGDDAGLLLAGLAILLLVYFPMRFVSANLLLKSGHVRMMEGVRYLQQMPGEDGRRIYEVMTQAAQIYLEESVRNVPSLTEASFWLGEFYRTSAQQPEKAIDIFNMTLKYGNNKNVYTALGSAHFDLALRETDLARRDELTRIALADWTMAATMNPNFGSPQLKLGQYYYQLQQYATAEVYFRRAIRFGESTLQTQELLASCQLMNDRTGEIETTLANLWAATKAAGAKPKPMLLKLAEIYLRQGNGEKAYEVLLDYTAADPANLQASKALFDLAIERKAYGIARDCLERIQPDRQSKEYHLKSAALYELAGDLERAKFDLALACQADTGDVSLIEKLKALDAKMKK